MRATRVALGLFAGFLGVSVGLGEALRLLALGGEERAFVACAVLAGIVLAVAPRFGSWTELGVTAPRHWRRPALFVVPSLLALSPLVLGVAPVSAGRLAFLVVAYAVTGVMEELMWRGVVQRVLGPLGAGRAVLITAALFGLAHLGNLVYRDGAAMVLAQAWGAFCFGVGYGALRHRTGTLVPLMVLHFVTDLAAAIGAVPTIPTLVAQDVVLLGMGLWLIARPAGVARPVAA
jgi:membrane protease YdiL (CAAX protease family)